MKILLFVFLVVLCDHACSAKIVDKLVSNFTGFGNADQRVGIVYNSDSYGSDFRSLVIRTRMFFLMQSDGPFVSVTPDEGNELALFLVTFDQSNVPKAAIQLPSGGQGYLDLTARPIIASNDITYMGFSVYSPVESSLTSPVITGVNVVGRETMRLVVCQTLTGTSSPVVGSLTAKFDNVEGKEYLLAQLALPSVQCSFKVQGKTTTVGSRNGYQLYILVIDPSSGTIVDINHLNSTSTQAVVPQSIEPLPNSPLGSVVVTSFNRHIVQAEAFSNYGDSLWRIQMTVSNWGPMDRIRLTSTSDEAQLIFNVVTENPISITLQSGSTSTNIVNCTSSREGYSLFGVIDSYSGEIPWAACNVGVFLFDVVGVLSSQSTDQELFTIGAWNCEEHPTLTFNGGYTLTKNTKLVDEDTCAFLGRFNIPTKKFTGAINIQTDMVKNSGFFNFASQNQALFNAMLTTGNDEGMVWMTNDLSVEILGLEDVEEYYELFEYLWPYYNVDAGDIPLSMVISRWSYSVVQQELDRSYHAWVANNEHSTNKAGEIQIND